MALGDDDVSPAGTLVEDRPARRGARNRPAPATDRWWLVEAPERPSRPRGGRGPAHHPTRPQTHSDGLPLGHLFEAQTPAAGLSLADAAQLVRGEWPARPPGHGAHPAGQLPGHHPGHPAARSGHAPLPRRRDLRAGRAVRPPAPQSPPVGLPLGRTAGADRVAGSDPAGGFGGFDSLVGRPADVPPAGPLAAPARTAPTAVPHLDLDTAALPRRRDLRRAEEATRSRRALRASRKGALTQAARSARASTTIARGAVLTGLVAVGVVTISGHQLDLARLAPGSTDTTAELALVPAADPFDGVLLTGEVSNWDAGPEVEAAVAAGVRELEKRQEAARKAAAKRAAEKAAAEARIAAKAKALRDAQRNPRAIGRIMAAERGWTGSQWTCLEKLWTRESQWRWYADNPSSSAYGIPQALPGSKMAAAGADWRTNPVTQIEWGLDYIADRYGSPCNAWAHSERRGWY